LLFSDLSIVGSIRFSNRFGDTVDDDVVLPRNDQGHVHLVGPTGANHG
jgi:hypothetical protein